MSEEQEIEMEENGSVKGHREDFPESISALNPADASVSKQPKDSRGKRLSGFARQGYWDEPSKDDPNITNREAKSIWARRMAAEGKIGGARPGSGRPRKQSVAEVVADKSSENADKIAKKLLDLALNHISPSINLQAVDRLNKYEQDYEKNMRDDEKELRKLSGDSLDAALRDVLEEYTGVQYDIEVSEKDIEDV
jgi:hypothetical protein